MSGKLLKLAYSDELLKVKRWRLETHYSGNVDWIYLFTTLAAYMTAFHGEFKVYYAHGDK